MENLREMTLHFTFINFDKKVNQFLNARRTTGKSFAYHKWYAYHSLGNAGLDVALTVKTNTDTIDNKTNVLFSLTTAGLWLSKRT